ncbi:MAG: proline dehydrogenase [Woeseiaceae bacterium]|jgi:proline dehydrogenase|nr:proline dehydrogenase [Woeseiaceae bacterium]
MPANPFHRLLVGTMPLMPRALVWRFSRRYIAGTHLDDAYRAVRELNKVGCTGTIDVLGEDITNQDQVNAALQLYREALDGIQDNSLQCGISVKLSELGLRFDVDGCKAAMRALMSSARQHGNFVRIDMEDSSVTSVTLDIYRELRRDFDRVGVVIQSCLRRSEDDVAALMAEGPTDIRLCKGIYIEPEDIAFTDADDIRDSYSELLDQLLEGGARVGIATHDPVLVERAEASIKRLGIEKDRYEFQMLLGVTERLRERLVAEGHSLRVYVPFGKLWYHYSMRRLRENPNIAGHIIKNLFVRN